MPQAGSTRTVRRPANPAAATVRMAADRRLKAIAETLFGCLQL
jgi:hypothetical protein